MSPLFDLTGRVALTLGSSKGMGRAMAEALAMHGAKVVIASRKQDQCDQAAAEINARLDRSASGAAANPSASGMGKAVGIACNAGNKVQLQSLVDQTRSTFGPIDILLNNAGVNPFYGSSKDIPDDAFDKIMAVNVKANLWICNMVLPDMVARGRGSIMVTSSTGAFGPSATLGAYNISKLADIALVRNLALEYGPSGVRVNAICPGLVKTDFAKALWDNPEAAARVNEQTPLRRLGEPEDFMGIAVYLASDASAWMTGQALTVCGGTNMWR